MKLRISEDLALPPNTVTSTLVVYGGKGMGKTNFGSVLVDLDVVILGGPHGDLPIDLCDEDDDL